jgi:hypothetical protein
MHYWPHTVFFSSKFAIVNHDMAKEKSFITISMSLTILFFFFSYEQNNTFFFLLLSSSKTKAFVPVSFFTYKKSLFYLPQLYTSSIERTYLIQNVCCLSFIFKETFIRLLKRETEKRREWVFDTTKPWNNKKNPYSFDLYDHLIKLISYFSLAIS